jgi:hypothetical protein
MKLHLIEDGAQRMDMLEEESDEFIADSFWWKTEYITLGEGIQITDSSCEVHSKVFRQPYRRSAQYVELDIASRGRDRLSRLWSLLLELIFPFEGGAGLS